jgi:hypothetical protein
MPESPAREKHEERTKPEVGFHRGGRGGGTTTNGHQLTRMGGHPIVLVLLLVVVLDPDWRTTKSALRARRAEPRMAQTPQILPRKSAPSVVNFRKEQPLISRMTRMRRSGQPRMDTNSHEWVDAPSSSSSSSSSSSIRMDQPRARGWNPRIWSDIDNGIDKARDKARDKVFGWPRPPRLPVTGH